MKTRIFIFFTLVFNTLFYYSQSTGITYQALIINPKGENVPGVNNLSAPLVNKEICMRFSIYDSNNLAEYVETIKTTTDKAGIVNLIIGTGNKTGGYASSFSGIVWDKNLKRLKVEFDENANCSNYLEISNQTFSYVPFSYYSSSTKEATATTTGSIQLAGDLAGVGSTAKSPKITDGAITTNKLANGAVVNSKIGEVISVINGGTGASNIVGYVVGNGQNAMTGVTSIPVSDVNGAQTIANLETDVATSSSPTTKYPSVKAIKDYVDNSVSGATIPDASTTIKGKIQLAGDLTGTAASPAIATGAVTTGKLADASVINSKLADDAVTTTKIKDGEVTDAKIANGISASKVGLGNVDNTSDANKPVSTLQQAALDLKENLSNKSTDITADGASNTKYPAVKAIKDYVDSSIASATIPDADTTTKGKLQLAGDLTGTAASPAIAAGAVTTVKLADDAVTTAKIKDGNVTTAKINDAAIITSKIDDAAVTTVKIKDGNVTTAKLADASVTNAKLAEPVSIANGGTGSSTQNFVDLTTAQTIAGDKTFNSDIIVNGVKVGKGAGNGDSNVAVGTDLGSGTGYRNTGVGTGALQNFSGTSFGNNTGIGYANMQGLTTGYGNTSLGGETLASVANNDNNTAIGNQTLRNAASSNNTALGANAGNAVTTGSGNTLLGSQADIGTGTNSNATAIGYGAVVNGDNTIQLGNGDITSVKTSGKLTTGTVTYPNTNGNSGQFLKTDGSGNASWSDPAINTNDIVDGAVTDDKIASGINKSKVGLDQVDNTSDADKPVSTAQQAALDLKENLSNKSTDVSADGSSDEKYPSVKSIKDYVDSSIASATIADADANTKGKLQLAGDLTGTAASPEIASGAVTYAKIQDVSATDKVLGRVSSGAGSIEEISTTGTGDVVRANSPVLVTPDLGTPSAIDLTNATNLPSSSITGTLNVANGGTGLTNVDDGNLLYGTGNNTLANTENLRWNNNNTTLHIKADQSNSENPSVYVDQIKDSTKPIWLSAGNSNLGNEAQIGLVGTSGDFFNGTQPGDAVVKAFSVNNDKRLFLGATFDSNPNLVLNPNGTSDLTGNLTISGRAEIGINDQKSEPALKLIGYSDPNTTGGGGLEIGDGGAVNLRIYRTNTNFLNISTKQSLIPHLGINADDYDPAYTLDINGTLGVRDNTTFHGNTTTIGTANYVSDVQMTQNLNVSGTLTASGITYPNSNGTAGQFLKTDGNGNATWTTIPEANSDLSNGFSGILPVANGGTGSSSQNFVDLTTDQTIAGAKTFSSDISVNGLPIGRGTYATTRSIAIGNNALKILRYAQDEIAIGEDVMKADLRGVNSIGIGNYALTNQKEVGSTWGANNNAVGYQSGYNVTIGKHNVFYGVQSGYTITEGNNNTVIGPNNSGYGITTGNSNTIIGRAVNLSPTLSNNVIFADGDANIRAQHDGTSWTLGTIGSGVWNGSTISIAYGGTGATTAAAARTNLGLGNVENTADADKPVSTAQQTALDLKEDVANKSTDISADGNSDSKYPSVKAIKDYVDTLNAAAGVADGSITSAKIADGTIVNADVASTAAIAYSKLNLTGSIATTDITDANVTTAKLADNAVTTAKITDANVTYAKIQNVSATDKVLGRVSTGAGTIEEISTTGSGNVVRATSPTLVTPNLGTPSAVDLTNATNLPLSAVTGTLGVAKGGTGLTSLTAGYIPFGNGTNAFGNSANLFWDNTNSRLGINTSTPSATFQIGTDCSSCSDNLKYFVDSNNFNTLKLGFRSSGWHMRTSSDSGVATDLRFSYNNGTTLTDQLIVSTLGTVSVPGSFDVTGTSKASTGTFSNLNVGTYPNYDINYSSSTGKLGIFGTPTAPFQIYGDGGFEYPLKYTSDGMVGGTLGFGFRNKQFKISTTSDSGVLNNMIYSYDNGTTNSEIMRLMNDGTVSLSNKILISANAAAGKVLTSDANGYATWANIPSLADGAVTSAKIADGTIANADIATTAAIAYSKLNLSGSIVTADIADAAVTTAKVNDGAVTTAKLADGSVTSAKITDGAIATADIADAAVTTAKVNDGAVTSAKIADATIATADIADANVTYAKIQNVSATNKILGRVSAGAGSIEEISTTGSGNVVRATSPALVTPDLGTPSAAVLTNATGLPLSSGVTGTLPIANGGTGATTKSAAFDALSPMSASGDIIYGGTSGTGTRLAKGTDGQVLTLVSGVPAWSNSGGTASVLSKSASYTITATDNAKYVVFSGSTASQTITLPSAVTVGAGREITIKNVASVSLTINATAGYLISDSTTTTASSLAIGIEPSNNWIKAISDGTNWIILRALF